PALSPPLTSPVLSLPPPPPPPYTLSLHDALPIFRRRASAGRRSRRRSTPPASRARPDSAAAGRALLSRSSHARSRARAARARRADRKSTRLNSSHDQISYAVFCLKKKKNTRYNQP